MLSIPTEKPIITNPNETLESFTVPAISNNVSLAFSVLKKSENIQDQCSIERLRIHGPSFFENFANIKRHLNHEPINQILNYHYSEIYICVTLMHHKILE